MMLRESPLFVAASILALSVVGSGCGKGELAVVLRSVSPAEGSARGGDVVTLSGSGFGPNPIVNFGESFAEIVSVSDTRIEVRTPPGIAGPVNVMVSTYGDDAILGDAFTYLRLPLSYADVSWTKMTPSAVRGALSTMADIDGDGDLDVVQAAGAEGVFIYPNDGNGALGEPTVILAGEPASHVHQPIVADFDGDGRVDLFLAATDEMPPRLYRGTSEGKGGFALVPSALPDLFGVGQTGVAYDIDADGDQDLILTGTASAVGAPPQVVILVNDGGVFTDETSSRLPVEPFDASGVVAANLDADEFTDLFFAGDTEVCRLFLGDGLGTFRRAAPDAIPYDPAPGAGIPAVGDIDGDGLLDIYLPTKGQDRIYLYTEGGFIDFSDVLLGVESGAGRSAELVDLDRDGHLDVLVVENPGRLRLYRNDGTGRLFDYTSSLAGDVTTLPAMGVAAGDLDGDGDHDLFLSRGDLARPALFLSWAPQDDADGDGLPDDADNCPKTPNPDQQNRDSHHFGCESASICQAETGCELHAAGGAAYLVCRNAAVTWAQASDSCVARGGALVTIGDAGENAFLASLAPADLWIGYTDSAVEGTFAGVTSYTSWAEGEPNDSGGNEDCAVITATGLWNDVPCDAPRGFICKDLRAKAADAGDACDGCPTKHDPEAPPVSGDAGHDGGGPQTPSATCGAGGAGGGGGGTP